MQFDERLAKLSGILYISKRPFQNADDSGVSMLHDFVSSLLPSIFIPVISSGTLPKLVVDWLFFRHTTGDHDGRLPCKDTGVVGGIWKYWVSVEELVEWPRNGVTGLLLKNSDPFLLGGRMLSAKPVYVEGIGALLWGLDASGEPALLSRLLRGLVSIVGASKLGCMMEPLRAINSASESSTSYIQEFMFSKSMAVVVATDAPLAFRLSHSWEVMPSMRCAFNDTPELGVARCGLWQS